MFLRRFTPTLSSLRKAIRLGAVFACLFLPGLAQESGASFLETLRENPFARQVLENLERLGEVNRLHVVLVLDTSGSMERLFPGVQREVVTFILSLREADELSLIVFADTPTLVFTGLRLDVSGKAQAIELIQALRATGAWTDLEEAERLTRRTLARINDAKALNNGIVLYATDNLNDPPPWKSARAIDMRERAINYTSMLSWQVYTLGLETENRGIASTRNFKAMGDQIRYGTLQRKTDLPAKTPEQVRRSMGALGWAARFGWILYAFTWLVLVGLLWFLLPGRRALKVLLVLLSVVLVVAFPDESLKFLKFASAILFFPLTALWSLTLGFYRIHPILMIPPLVAILFLARLAWKAWRARRSARPVRP